MTGTGIRRCPVRCFLLSDHVMEPPWANRIGYDGRVIAAEAIGPIHFP